MDRVRLRGLAIADPNLPAINHWFSLRDRHPQQNDKAKDVFDDKLMLLKLRDLVGAKYKWQRMKEMMSLPLTTTFDWHACNHRCKSLEV